MKFVTAAFYKFVVLSDYQDRRAGIVQACEVNDIRGTILLAPEGINGTIAGTPDKVHALVDNLREEPRFADLAPKYAWTDELPFLRMKVRLKREIVSLGVPGIDAATQAGTYVPPEHWNALISDPDVVTIDTRNDYEVAIGTFVGAIDPGTERFRDLPTWLEQQTEITPDTRVAMFCTGGIRCEKSTALLRARGFNNVYHLEGGILKYLETVPKEDSLWKGECFVFDERVTVNHDMQAGSYSLCRACRQPLSAQDLNSPLFVEGVSCVHCHGKRSDEQMRGGAERQRQIELARNRGEAHMGVEAARRLNSRERNNAELPVLYSFRRCPYAMRARLALRASGIACELREVVLRDKPAALLEASPKGTVPVLITIDGRVIDESLAIMLWALRQSDPEGWLAADADAMLTLIGKTDGDFKHHLDRYKYPDRYDNVEPLDHRKAGAAFLQNLAGRLDRQTYLFGDAPSLADMAIAPFVRQFAMTDRNWFDAQPWPALLAWLNRFLESSAFAAIMKKYPQWQDGDPVTRF